MARLASSHEALALGDMLQRMALIAPDDLAAIEQIVRDVYAHAEQRYRLKRPLPAHGVGRKYPWPT